MKKMTAVLLLGLVMFGGVAFADDEVVLEPAAEATAPGVFQRYIAIPTQWIHRGAWGIITLAFKVGKAPIDKGFELVGSFLGSDPNAPIWQ